MNWTKFFDDAFDYHSKTTISISSEIRPRHNQSDSSDEFKNQTRYSMTSMPAHVLTQNDSNTDRTNNGNQDKNNSNSTSADSVKGDEKRSRPASTISKHRITEDESIVIYSPEYFEDLSALLLQYTETDRGKATLANYMAWSLFQTLTASLPKSFRDASKGLRKALYGSESIEVTWRYCVSDTNQVMGFALGSLFVKRVFQGKSKARAEEMIHSIKDAFNDNLVNLSWMDDKTRILAREKADHINQMIGFPDYILSPEKLNDKYAGVKYRDVAHVQCPSRHHALHELS